MNLHRDETTDTRVVTLVIPVFNEESGLPIFLPQLEEFARAARVELGVGVRAVLVDDGSIDRTARALADYRPEAVQEAVVLRLNRNSGAHAAISAGLQEAYGQAVVVMACDGQDPFDVVTQLIGSVRSGFDVAWAQRRSRVDSALVRATSRAYAAMMSPKGPDGQRVPTGSFLAVDGTRVEELNRLAHVPWPTFEKVAWLQAASTRVPYDRPGRAAGASKWSHRRRMSSGFAALLRSRRGLTSVSRILAGLIFMITAVAIVASIGWSVFVGALPGWTTVTTVGLVSLAVQSVFFVIIVEYVARTYWSTFNVPLFVVNDHFTHVPPPGSEC